MIVSRSKKRYIIKSTTSCYSNGNLCESCALTVPAHAHGRTKTPLSDWHIRHARFSTADDDSVGDVGGVL